MTDFGLIEMKDISFYAIGNKTIHKIYFTVYQLLDCFQKGRNEQERIFSPSRKSQGDIESQRTVQQVPLFYITFLVVTYGISLNYSTDKCLEHEIE